MSHLPEAEYRMIQRSVPICCVDLLPVEWGQAGRHSLRRVGLILRDAPHQGRRWCLVGGRVRHGETLREALDRHLTTTLGPRVSCDLPPDPQPLYVAQYFPQARPGHLLDPRQHSVALTYAASIVGPVIAQNEAHEFRWFSPDSLPWQEIGFDQDRVVRECLTRATRR